MAKTVLRLRKKKPKLGSGGRFKAEVNKLSHEKGVRNPRALAAWEGDQKYGKHQMAEWAAKGRKR